VLLGYVDKILNFGFLGLAFLMIYLGYDLIKKVSISGEDVKPNTLDLIKNFMRVALIFMVLAGPLQWATIGIKHLLKEEKVELLVGLSKVSWEEGFGNIYIRKDGEDKAINIEPIIGEFKKEDEILLDMNEVISAIELMRKQIELLTDSSNNPDSTYDEG